MVRDRDGFQQQGQSISADRSSFCANGLRVGSLVSQANPMLLRTMANTSMLMKSWLQSYPTISFRFSSRPSHLPSAVYPVLTALTRD